MPVGSIKQGLQDRAINGKPHAVDGHVPVPRIFLNDFEIAVVRLTVMIWAEHHNVLLS